MSNITNILVEEDNILYLFDNVIQMNEYFNSTNLTYYVLEKLNSSDSLIKYKILYKHKK